MRKTLGNLYEPLPLRPAAPRMAAVVKLPEPIQILPAGLSYRMAVVTGHGPHREFVAPGRYVVEIDGASPWASASPELCLDTSNRGVWLRDEVLVCLSCGLDCT